MPPKKDAPLGGVGSAPAKQPRADRYEGRSSETNIKGAKQKVYACHCDQTSAGWVRLVSGSGSRDFACGIGDKVS